eukprot:2175722-Rhodomonas_salina.1
MDVFSCCAAGSMITLSSTALIETLLPSCAFGDASSFPSSTHIGEVSPKSRNEKAVLQHCFLELSTTQFFGRVWQLSESKAVSRKRDAHGNAALPGLLESNPFCFVR